jgi:hypothetical protein
MMTDSFLKAAIRDAAVTADARGLMPLAEARALVGALEVYEKGASEESSVLGSDRAWAALLSLENGDEFLKAALRIRFKFHVRGHDNLAAFERYGAVILPWISAAIDARGTLRNVPWCLYPCLSAIGTADADATKAREYPKCRLDEKTFPYALCAGRFETPGLLRVVLGGERLDAVL